MAAALGVVVHYLATPPRRAAGSALAPGGIGGRHRRDAADRRPLPRQPSRDDGDHAHRRSRLAAGTRVYLNWTSANRDETVFGDPDTYRPEQHAPHNLVYGVGIHACPGRPLATMELVVAVQALLQATSGIEPAPDAVPERETYPLGGWRRVPVRLRDR